MPHANSNRSFDAAVRHLFRHIEDASALRYNPITCRRFEPSPAPRPNSAILAEIRAAILSAADTCYAEDVSAGHRARAERQRTILKAICGRVPVAEITAILALSSRQYYRDRMAICRRVANAVASEGFTKTSCLEIREPLEFLLRRADALIEHGFAQKASRELEQTFKDAGTQQAKVAILLELSKAAVASGNVRRADESLTRANEFLGQFYGGFEAARLRERAQLISVRVARAAGRYADACAQLDTIIGLETKHEVAVRAPSEEILGLELESCTICCERGQYLAARRHYNEALVLKQRLGTVASEYLARLAYMASYLGSEPGALDSLFSTAREGLDVCTVLGSANGTLYSSLRLAHYFARIGDEDQAHQYCRWAFDVAKLVEGHEAVVEASIHTASALIKTRFWRTLDPLLFNVEKFARKNTLEWIGLKSFQGQVLRKTGRAHDAVEALRVAERAIGSYRMNVKHAIILLELAIALRGVGLDAEARDHLRSAIALGEETRETSVLFRLYRAGFALLGESRFARLAASIRPARPG